MFQVIIEISLYPLTEDYDSRILTFVERLRSYPEIDVSPGPTTTIIRGTYDIVFRIVEKECKDVLGIPEKCAIVMKVLNTA